MKETKAWYMKEKIVEGAVSMEKMAIEQLDKEAHLQLDEERKANMKSSNVGRKMNFEA